MTYQGVRLVQLLEVWRICCPVQCKLLCFHLPQIKTKLRSGRHGGMIDRLKIEDFCLNTMLEGGFHRELNELVIVKTAIGSSIVLMPKLKQMIKNENLPDLGNLSFQKDSLHLLLKFFHYGSFPSCEN